MPEREYPNLLGMIILSDNDRVSTILLCAWATAHLEKEPQVRTVLFATGTLFSYLFSAFLPIAAYPAAEAPHWKIGAKLYLGLSVLATVLFITIFFVLKWQAKRDRR
jgi:VIT1/CCC1 family predicted Fe2+/Mn2+ transporter